MFVINFLEFHEWKTKIELETGTKWVSYSNKSKYQKTYYRCNRSGNFDYKDEARDRDAKGTITTRTNTECSSHLVHYIKDGMHHVKFCITHSSHTIDPEFLRLSNATKLEVEEKLRQGVSMKLIIQAIRAETDSTCLASQFISRKELENIANKHNIGKDFQLDSDDAKSVDEYVKRDQGKTVIFYKPVGVVDERYPNLSKEDFGLAIMDEKQRKEVVRAMNNPPGVLLSDATHGTSQYDIKLLTVMTINPFGNGVPIAFFYTTKEDQDALEYLFAAIKSTVGNLTPKAFMTDDAAAYWNAFESIMDSPTTKRLLCIWHVDKAWRKKLKKLVKDEPTRIIVYQKLCMIRSEPDESKFVKMMKNFVDQCEADESTKLFAQYFVKKYNGRSRY